MKNWICKHCKFRFHSEKPRDCPYCGRDNLEMEKDADELLDEIGRIIDE